MTTATAQIEVAELRAMLESGEPVTLLDVRTAEDRAEWAIPGSLHAAAYAALKAGDRHALDEVALPPGPPVVTVCGAGKVSLTAAALLRERGYDARSLTGGMKAWSLAWNSADVPLTTDAACVVQLRRTGKGCLSYLVSSGGEAAVIDPSLDPEAYLRLAASRGWTITRVLETHIHADHLMRSRALAERAGATLHLPATGRVGFPAAMLRDGDEFTIGDAALRVLATPGHTPESVAYLLGGEALFTGDTLFLAGVGRPDLEASPDEARARAHLLYRSLQRLLALPAETSVLPGHTSQPVAFDGQPLRATLGELRARIAMLELDEAAFVQTILARIPPTPPNHARIVELNEAGLFPEGDPTDLEAGANRCAVS